MKKQLLLLVMIFLPMVASADAVEIDGIYYNVLSKFGTAEVTYNPNKYSGEIVIPESVTYEGANYNVTSIGNSAFYNCSSLTSVAIPNSVTSIEGWAFSGCSWLNSVTIGNCVTSIGEKAFHNCSGLTSITIPNSVTSIGEKAFHNCSRLVSVHIFSLEAWCKISFSSNPLSYAHHLYLNGEEIKDLVIPNSVTSIKISAFSGCSGLTSVTIPNSVTSIENGAFSGCSGLTTVTIPNSVTSIGNGAFYGCSGLTSFTIPNSVTTIGPAMFQDCSALTSITIPNSVTSIGDQAFYNCSGLTSVTIGNSVTSIGYMAFIYCSGLTSITIPNSVTTIAEIAFKGCSKIKTITLGNGLTYISSRAFSDCPELTDVYSHAINVPNSNNSIFENSYIDYATLHVPEESIDAYKGADPWKNFKKIVKIMPEYNLTYMVDDKVYKSYRIEEGATIIAEPSPTKDGYTFSGWSEIPETMPAHDVTVTGAFTINKYKLIYMVDDTEYKSYDIEYGATITPEAEPTKEGYTFSGWSEIPETMPSNDVMVTGTFTINQYTITYIIDNEVYTTQTVDYGSIIVPPTTSEREGYDFAWGDYPETMPAYDITIYGTYTTGIEAIMANPQKGVIYDLNGVRQNEPQKGINIINGKKYLNRK